MTSLELDNPRRWLVTGASGLLGGHLCAKLIARGAHVIGVYRSHPIEMDGVEAVQLDVSDLEALEAYCRDLGIDVIVHAAALTNVDACEEDEAGAALLHGEVSKLLASIALSKQAKYVYISTDHLWDGTKRFVAEDEPPAPINAYARTKLLGEVRALDANPESLIVRTNFFGPGKSWQKSFSDWVVNTLQAGQDLTGFDNVYFTPIVVDSLCDAIIRLVELDAKGVYNVAGRERVSKYEFMVRLAARMGLDEALIKRGQMEQSSLAAPRPVEMSLDTHKVEDMIGWAMPSLDESFNDLLAD